MGCTYRRGTIHMCTNEFTLYWWRIWIWTEEITTASLSMRDAIVWAVFGMVVNCSTVHFWLLVCSVASSSSACAVFLDQCMCSVSWSVLQQCPQIGMTGIMVMEHTWGATAAADLSCFILLSDWALALLLSWSFLFEAEIGTKISYDDIRAHIVTGSLLWAVEPSSKICCKKESSF